MLCKSTRNPWIERLSPSPAMGRLMTGPSRLPKPNEASAPIRRQLTRAACFGVFTLSVAAAFAMKAGDNAKAYISAAPAAGIESVDAALFSEIDHLRALASRARMSLGGIAQAQSASLREESALADALFAFAARLEAEGANQAELASDLSRAASALQVPMTPYARQATINHIDATLERYQRQLLRQHLAQ